MSAQRIGVALTDEKVKEVFERTTSGVMDAMPADQDPFTVKFHEFALDYVIGIHHERPFLDYAVCDCGCGAVTEGDEMAVRAVEFTAHVIMDAIHGGVHQCIHGDSKSDVENAIRDQVQAQKDEGSDPIDSEEALSAYIRAAQFGWEIGNGEHPGMMEGIKRRLQMNMQNVLGDLMDSILGGEEIDQKPDVKLH